LQIGTWTDTFGSRAPYSAGTGRKRRRASPPHSVSLSSKLSAISSASSSAWAAASAPHTTAVVTGR
jgi:hypothetical protein